MTVTHDYKGKRLGKTFSQLGEGPSFDALTETVWWFDILGKKLHELHLPSGRENSHDLPFMGSVIANIDGKRQLVGSDQGLFIRDSASGMFELYCELEEDKPGNRSNDGRMHPSGSLWISTMGKNGETAAGSIYHVRQGIVTEIVDHLTIPNSICFSPDGSIGYYVDTRKNHLMRVPLDADTGLPSGEPTIFIDQNGKPGGMDGSVCDADGFLWNARWGEGAVDRYSPEGKHISRHFIPAKQPTCPVILGEGRLGVTSAWTGLAEDDRRKQPEAGGLFEIAVPVRCQAEASYQL